MKALSGRILIILFLAGWNVCLNAQSAADSLQSEKDRLQDVRIEQLRRSVYKLGHEIESDRILQARSTDSLLMLINTLRNEIKILEQDKSEKEHEIEVLHQLIEKSEQHSIHYREKIKVILWICGPAFFLLLATSFILLYMTIMKSKKLTLDRIHAVNLGSQHELEQMASDLTLERKKDLKKVRREILKTVKKRFKRKK